MKVSHAHLNNQYQGTYQVEDVSGRSLVLGALSQEDQTLTGLGSPSGDGVSDGGLLILVEDRELLRLEGLIMEVDKAFGEAQTPVQREVIRGWFFGIEFDCVRRLVRLT